MSIIRTGLFLLISLFLIIIMYFIISTPLETIFDGFANADVSEANDEMAIYLPIIRNAMSMAFAVAIVAPVMIFIIRVFAREPDWYYED